MWEYYLKLLELLKEVPGIKKDLWWWIIYRLENYKWWYCFSWSKEECLNHLWSWKAPNWFTSVKRFIWDVRKIEERHIKWYAEEKWILYNNNFIDLLLDKIIFQKPFHQQDEEVYKQINEFFKKYQ